MHAYVSPGNFSQPKFSVESELHFFACHKHTHPCLNHPLPSSRPHPSPNQPPISAIPFKGWLLLRPTVSTATGLLSTVNEQWNCCANNSLRMVFPQKNSWTLKSTVD